MNAPSESLVTTSWEVLCISPAPACSFERAFPVAVEKFSDRPGEGALRVPDRDEFE